MKQLLSALRSPFALMLVMSLCVLAGCSALDAFFGYDATAPDGGLSKPAPESEIGGILSVLFPWGGLATVVGGAARWLYVEVRGKQSKAALPNVILGVITAVLGAKDGNVDVAQLYGSISGANVLFANKALFAKLVADVQAAVKAQRTKGGVMDLAAIEKDVEAIEAVQDPSAAAPAAPAPAPSAAPANTPPPASA